MKFIENFMNGDNDGGSSSSIASGDYENKYKFSNSFNDGKKPLLDLGD